MSVLKDLEQIEIAARQQGSSLIQIIAFAAKGGPGVDVLLRRPVPEGMFDPSEADSLEELIQAMSRLSEALAALTLEAEEQRTQLASVVQYIQGVPNLVAAAVQDALAGAGVDDAAAAAAINSARQTISDGTDAALAAIAANRLPGDPGAPITSVNPEPATPPEVRDQPATADIATDPAPAADTTTADTTVTGS